MAEITFDTSLSSLEELTAIIALCASLGGRLPEHPLLTNLRDTADRTGGWRISSDVVDTADMMAPIPESERLLAQAAAERTAPPPPAEEPDDGQSHDPASLDVTGVPWDERIHSSNKKRTAQNEWRKRRGVDDVTFGRIHGELAEAAMRGQGEPSGTGTSPETATMPAAIPPAPPPPAPVSAAPAPPPPSGDPAAPLAPTAAASAPTAASPTGAPAASGDGSRFADFPAFVSQVNTLGKVYAELNRIAAELAGPGVTFPNLKDRPDLWEMFYDVAAGQ